MQRCSVVHAQYCLFMPRNRCCCCWLQLTVSWPVRPTCASFSRDILGKSRYVLRDAHWGTVKASGCNTLHADIFIYMCIYIFRQQTKDNRTCELRGSKFSEFNLLLTSSWMQFSFVKAVPKYLNVATFSREFVSYICTMILSCSLAVSIESLSYNFQIG